MPDEKEEKKDFITVSNLFGVLKYVALALPIATAIALAFWKAEVRAWLAEEMMIELQKAENRNWHYENLNSVLRGLGSQQVTELQNNPKLSAIIRDGVRDELSGDQPNWLKEFEAKHQTVIEAIMNPPAFQSLEAIVTQRVDAIYTFELYDRRKLQVYFAEGSDAADNAIFQNVSVSDLTARFYAARDQQISISVQPNYGTDWREAISNGSEAMLLKIGGQDVEVGLGPRELDITCDVRQGLGLRADGMIQVRAEPRSRNFDKTDGFNLDITIVARKGDRLC